MSPPIAAPGARFFSKKNFPRQPEWIATILISAVILWLHLFFWIHAGGFWRDEVNSLNIASSHSLRGMTHDSFPILMPLIIRGWLAFGLGKSDLELRALGLLIGLGIPAALWISSWKAKRSAPLLGLALFGLNSHVIVFGDSLRAYGLGSLLIILATAAACRFLKKPSWTRAGWFALFAILSAQALYQNAILIGAICIGALSVCARRKNWRSCARIFSAGALAAISLLPYVPNLLEGRQSSAVLRTGIKLPRFLAQFTDSLGFPLEQYVCVWGLLALFIVACAFVLVIRNVKISSAASGETVTEDLCLFAGITLPVALAGYCIFLWFAALPGQSWYLLPVMAVAATCFDAAFPVLKHRWRAAFFGFIAATALISIPAARCDLNFHFTNIDRQTRQLSAHVSPNDYVIVVPWFCGISFAHYFRGSTPWTTLPPLADHSVHRYDLVRMQLQNTNAIQPVLEQIGKTLQSGHRVWVLAAQGWMGIPDPGTVPPATLPPAPLNFSGWSSTPYTIVWASQTAHFLGSHAAEFLHLKNPAAGIQIAEDMELFVADGWKTNSP